MDSMPPCHNALEILKTRRRLAFARAHELMGSSDPSPYTSAWCSQIDEVLDKYDNAVEQIKELVNNGAPCENDCGSLKCRCKD